MARKKITSIAPSSIRDIAKGMGTIRNLPPRGPRGTSWDDTPDYLPPEVYVARTPPEGIAALVGDFTSWTGTGTGPTEFGTGTGSCRPGWAGTGTGTGTGHWGTDDDLPGYADCELYRIVEVCHRDTMLHLDKSVRVYNVSTTPIAGDIYIPVMREKFGRWIAAQPGSGGGTQNPFLAAGGRLTVNNGDPVQYGSGALLYYVPYVHDKLALWDSPTNTYIERSIKKIAGYHPLLDPTTMVYGVGTGTFDNDFTFDVYAYWDSATQTIKLEGRKWTNSIGLDQTQAYADWHFRIVVSGEIQYYGVRIKGPGEFGLDDPTRRYLGTARYDQVNDAITDRGSTTAFLWNAENRVRHECTIYGDTTIGYEVYYSRVGTDWECWGPNGASSSIPTGNCFRWVQGFSGTVSGGDSHEFSVHMTVRAVSLDTNNEVSVTILINTLAAGASPFGFSGTFGYPITYMPPDTRRKVISNNLSIPSGSLQVPITGLDGGYYYAIPATAVHQLSGQMQWFWQHSRMTASGMW